jgi:hypothetical protein
MKWPPVSAFADEACTKFGVGDVSHFSTGGARIEK